MSISTQSQPAVTYRKTQSGEWVAYGPVDIVRAGATVQVAKRDGSTKAETVVRVGKAFTAGNFEMVYGYLAGAGATKQASSQGRGSRDAGPGPGYPYNDRRCYYCGGPGPTFDCCGDM